MMHFNKTCDVLTFGLRRGQVTHKHFPVGCRLDHFVEPDPISSCLNSTRISMNPLGTYKDRTRSTKPTAQIVLYRFLDAISAN